MSSRGASRLLLGTRRESRRQAAEAAGSRKVPAVSVEPHRRRSDGRAGVRGSRGCWAGCSPRPGTIGPIGPGPSALPARAAGVSHGRMSGSPSRGTSLEEARVAASGSTRISSGDLFASHHTKIHRYILSIVRDPVEADDLTQEVFLLAHRKLESLRDPDALVSWLYRIATHVCYDRFRKSSRQPRIEPLDAEGSVGASSQGDVADAARLDQVIERTEMSACVRNYIEDLSTEYRQVIFLHDLEEVSSPEIAEMLGATLDAVKIRLHRARRKLQVALKANCDFSCDEQGVLVCEPAADAPSRLGANASN